MGEDTVKISVSCDGSNYNSRSIMELIITCNICNVCGQCNDSLLMVSEHKNIAVLRATNNKKVLILTCALRHL